MQRLQRYREQGDSQSHADVFKPLRLPDRSGVPKYQRFANTVLDAIMDGVWPPGGRLPGEEELVQLARMSLGTVQRGLRLLADQGLVVRRHGLGSFVADHPRRIDPPVFCQFTDDDGQVLPLYSSAIQREVLHCKGAWSAYLKADARSVMRLDRIFDINGEFRVLSRFHADLVMLKRLWEAPLQELNGANFMSIIETECRLPITDVAKLMRFERLGPEVCELLRVECGTSGLLVRVIAMAGRDTCIFYQELFIPPNGRLLQFPDHRATAASPAAGAAVGKPVRRSTRINPRKLHPAKS